MILSFSETTLSLRKETQAGLQLRSNKLSRREDVSVAKILVVFVFTRFFCIQ